MKNSIRAGTIFVTAFLLTMSACNENLLVDQPQHGLPNGARQAVDLTNVALGVNYVAETFTCSQIQSFAKRAGEAEKAFETMAASPRLDRKSVDVKVYKDGSFEMTTIRLEPERNDLIPVARRSRETVSPYKTIVRNGEATFYDQSDRVTGRYKLNDMHFKPLFDLLKQHNKADKTDVVNKITGYPSVDEAEVLDMVRSKNAEVRKDKGITKVKFDLTAFSTEARSNTDKAPKYATQYYDFAKKLMLGGEVYDKQTDKLLHRLIINYKSGADGSTVDQVRSESYEDDPNTGRSIRHIRHQTYRNMTVVSNL